MPKIRHNIGVIRRLRISSYASMILLAFFFMGIITPFYIKPEDTESVTGIANESSITFTSTRNLASVNLWVDSTSGTAAFSDASQKIQFSIATNNVTGYKVYLRNTTTDTSLKNDTNSFSAITYGTSVAQSTFTSGTTYNGKWGIVPSYYNSSTNSSVRGVPTSANDMLLRSTTAANSSAHSYTIGMAARADFSKARGDYTTSNFQILYVANLVAYSISYDANTNDTVTNMPSTQSSSTNATTVVLSSNVPVRAGKRFLGWCNVYTTVVDDADTCSGLVFQPGASYGIDQTAANTITLHAMWGGCNSNATTIGTGNPSTDAYCMQDMNDTVIASMPVYNGTAYDQYRLMDKRDGKMYSISRLADGKVWMTQSLDLDLDSTKTYTHADTDLGYPDTDRIPTGATLTTDENATWTPANSTSTTSWERDPSTPMSYDPGDIYYYLDDNLMSSPTVYNSLSACQSGINIFGVDVDPDCGHYHVGNYYNRYAAVAANTSSDISGEAAPNSICPAGWKLPDLRDYDNIYDLDTEHLWFQSGLITKLSGGSFAAETWKTSDSYVRIQIHPLYLVPAGEITNATSPIVSYAGTEGHYWSSLNTVVEYKYDASNPYPAYSVNAGIGMSVRCVARMTTNMGTTTVVYNSNGGSGTMSSTSISGGRSARLDYNDFSRSGYAFNGWNTAMDGSGLSYDDHGRFYAVAGYTGNVVLYAQWKKTVTFVAGTHIETIIVAKQSGTRKPYYKPYYATQNNNVTLDVDTGDEIMITVVPDAGYKLNSWTQSTPNQSGTLASTTLLTTKLTVGGTATSPTWTASATLGTYSTMQNAICSSTTGPKNLTDSRNNRSYTVAPITVGVTTYCYMLSNLRLEGETTLSSSTSDVSANTFTLPSQTTWTSGSHYCKAMMKYVNNEYYYNWYAATANPTTGVSSSISCATEDRDNASLGSICPKGWTLPTYATSGTLTPASLWGSGTNPGYLAATGHVDYGVQGAVGNLGKWWSSDRSGTSDSTAYYLSLSATSNTNNVSRSTSQKRVGVPVRCVSKFSTPEEPNAFQGQ